MDQTNVYGNTASAGEGSSLNLLEPGVHVVQIESITVLRVTTSKYDGEVADIKLVGKDGGELSTRVFPFKYEEGRKDYNGNTLDFKAQFEEYFGKINHMFFKAAGSQEKYTSATMGATSFADLMQKAASVVTKANGGFPFWQMIIADSNNYSKVAMWRGGSCEAYTDNAPCTLKFNIEKYGKKAPVSTEQTDNPDLNKLPFDM
jgi:hypothetical protein